MEMTKSAKYFETSNYFKTAVLLAWYDKAQFYTLK